jgi:hypothetical protein
LKRAVWETWETSSSPWQGPRGTEDDALARCPDCGPGRNQLTFSLGQDIQSTLVRGLVRHGVFAKPETGYLGLQPRRTRHPELDLPWYGEPRTYETAATTTDRTPRRSRKAGEPHRVKLPVVVDCPRCRESVLVERPSDLELTGQG